MRFDRRFTVICVVLAMAFLTEPHDRCQAEESALITIGPRVGFSTTSTPLLGKQQKEDLRLYDVAGVFRLPWYSSWDNGNLKLGTRLITSLGVIEGAGGIGLISTVVPDLALSGWNGLISLDAGLGVGLLSRTRFGLQDFGGPAQIVGTVGISFAPLTHGYAGFRLQHLSDAGWYGSNALGVDMYLLETGYKF
jgi:hypothetical protein